MLAADHMVDRCRRWRAVEVWPHLMCQGMERLSAAQEYQDIRDRQGLWVALELLEGPDRWGRMWLLELE